MAVAKTEGAVAVEWIDSSTFQGWHSKGQSFEAQPCSSVGFVVEDSKEWLTLAGSKTPNQWCQIMTIPKVAIKRIRALK